MSSSAKCCVLILGATIVAAALRLPRLAQRPMHGDEAIHAEKLGRLLEDGYYRYDPHEYHGPTLNYLTLIPAWLSSAKNLTQVTEVTLRIVPVLLGMLLVLLSLLVLDGLGRTAAACAAFLTAISPAMVFYSRYYIMEMLLVCFTFGAMVCGYRYARSRNLVWALLAGAFLGLMHASKETCVIAFGSMLLALLLVLRTARRADRSALDGIKTVKPWHLIAGLAAAAIVSTLFYSSFFSHPAGILDSVRTYATYWDRAGHSSLHIHPWYYYLRMLLYFRYGTGPAWSEAFIVLLAVAGCVVAVSKRRLPGSDLLLLRFVALYTLIMTVIYSVIPYKTPWCLLGFLHGMILLAGVGAAAMIELAPSLVTGIDVSRRMLIAAAATIKLPPNVLARTVIIVLLAASGGHLAWQAYLANYVYYADSRNPYVYAHPTTEVFTVANRVQELAQAHPDGRDMDIQVICPGRDYWPLPWYLRSFRRVGWYEEVPAGRPSAPVIIISLSVEAALTKKLYEQTPLELRQMYMYMFDEPYYVWLRPKVKLIGLARKDLWERFRQRQRE